MVSGSFYSDFRVAIPRSRRIQVAAAIRGPATWEGPWMGAATLESRQKPQLKLRHGEASRCPIGFPPARVLSAVLPSSQTVSTEKNKLYYGDNLEVLKLYVKDESVDLVYLDPPLNSRQDYNVLFAEKDGSQSSSQIRAFEDTWEWNTDARRSYELIVEQGGHSEFARIFPHSRVDETPPMWCT